MPSLQDTASVKEQAPAAQLAAADASASDFSASAPGDPPPCPLFFALEVLVVGEDDLPVAGVAIELGKGSGGALQGATAADGLARFEGLSAGQYTLCPYDLDEAAWTLLRSEPLSPEARLTSGPAAWSGSPAPAPAPALTHPIASGESTDLLAWQHGLYPQTVWLHKENADLRNRRESCNVLAPGDPLYLPAIVRSSISGQTGNRYVIRRKGVPSRIRVRLYRDFVTMANKPCLLEIPGAATATLNTDADGVLEAYVPPDTATVTVTLTESGERLVLNVGMLEPFVLEVGWRQRMQQMGFPVATEEAELSEDTRGYLRRLQESFGLKVTGEPDEPTVRQLFDLCDAPSSPASPVAGVYKPDPTAESM